MNNTSMNYDIFQKDFSNLQIQLNRTQPILDEINTSSNQIYLNMNNSYDNNINNSEKIQIIDTIEDFDSLNNEDLKNDNLINNNLNSRIKDNEPYVTIYINKKKNSEKKEKESNNLDKIEKQHKSEYENEEKKKYKAYNQL